MNGKISFVGAGPGAPDLITLRGAKLLAEADTVIYAGSLVNEKILETASHAEFFNSAKLALEEVLEIMIRAYESGKKVVRLHTGDPAMYGAVSEQFRELEKHAIPYDVVPGVSSVFAAAAELKAELTMPALSQTVILTRDAGRTPVPENESLEKLAALGTTLCLFLSAGDLDSIREKLIAAGRSPETPAAAIYRASWENQQIIRATIATLPEKMRDAGIKRQTMIVIGSVLDRNGDLSKLYDTRFATGYRHHQFRGEIALFALTRRAALKASEIAAGLEKALVFVPEKFKSAVPAIRVKTFPDGAFGETFQSVWNQYEAFVMVMAAGITVRHAGKLCKDKKTDPAVVVCDEAGNYAVSLLSGHIGGANALARDIARITGGKPVITTASDVENLPAFDEFAVRKHYTIMTPETLTEIASAVVNGEQILLAMPEKLFEKEFAHHASFSLMKKRDDGIIEIHAGGKKLILKKQNLVLGIGCRKGISADRIAEVANHALERAGVAMDEIDSVASATAKQNEPGLLEFAERSGKPIRFFPPEELNTADVPNPSEAAKKHIGANSVSEASALLGAGKNAHLILEKYADQDVTAAIAGGSGNE